MQTSILSLAVEWVNIRVNSLYRFPTLINNVYCQVVISNFLCPEYIIIAGPCICTLPHELRYTIE